MAQAVIDDHPLADYLRDAGEVRELFPGGAPEFEAEACAPLSPVARSAAQALQSWVPARLRHALHMSRRLLAWWGLDARAPQREFAERFKHRVIESALLSSSLSYSHNPPPTPTSPGHFLPDLNPGANIGPPASGRAAALPVALGFGLAVLVPLALAQGRYVFATVVVIVLKLCVEHDVLHAFSRADGDGADMGRFAQTLRGLNALIAAHDVWDGVVSEAMSSLDADDRAFPRSPSPLSPSSPLRITLSSSLQTTQSQCDTLRGLLGALTSAALLAPMAEMYAPPSPALRSIPLPSLPSRSRPASLAPPMYVRARRISAPADDGQRPASWAGSYGALGHGRRRRPELPSFLGPGVRPGMRRGSSSAPTTPPLDGPEPEYDAPFGVAALREQRARRASVRSLFAEPQPSSSSSGGSRFTTLGPAFARPGPHLHPLSKASLGRALTAALAAKRFACAHLLALKFADQRDGGEDEDEEVGESVEGYWEDVRSVVGLLTATFEDTAARLSDALAETARQTELSDASSEDVPLESPFPEHHLPDVNDENEDNDLPSFAPMPSHIGRLAAHIGTMSAALDDARSQLRALALQAQARTFDPETAIGAHDALRKELGLALRECERSRAGLLDRLGRNHKPARAADDAPLRARHTSEDFSSGDSDQTLFHVDEPDGGALLLVTGEEVCGAHADDERPLPLLGLEQVFESRAGPVGPFARERSKLTREERIAQAKRARESSGAAFASVLGGPRDEDDSGPAEAALGSDVVQELKDVISKVGEQRRRLHEPPPPPAEPEPIPPDDARG